MIDLKAGTVLLDSEEFKKACLNLAFQIGIYTCSKAREAGIEVEEIADKFCVVAIKGDGKALSKSIVSFYESIFGVKLPVAYVDPTTCNDNFSKSMDVGSKGGTEWPSPDYDPNGKHLILLDTVIENARTVHAAISTINLDGRPGSVGLATLIDRNNREMPYQPNVCYAKMPNIPRDLVLKPVGEPVAYMELQKRA